MKLEDVKTGDVLMVFLPADDTSASSLSASSWVSVGGATSHSLSISPEYTEISCKDAGQFAWKKLTKVSYEIQTENLYIKKEFVDLVTKALNDTEFTVVFGESNWDKDGLGDAAAWHPAAGEVYQGTVKISSLSSNDASGDNATYSATFTGSGTLKQVTITE